MAFLSSLPLPEYHSRLVKKVLYKLAFHGGLTNVWGSLMTIPEVISPQPHNIFAIDKTFPFQSWNYTLQTLYIKKILKLYYTDSH